MKKRSFVVFDNFLGRIDDLLFYCRNRRRYIRRLKRGEKSKKAASPRQLLGQVRFRYTVSFYRALGDTLLREAWRLVPRPEGMTGYHCFIHCNYPAFDLEGGIPDPTRLKVCAGDLRLPLGVYVDMPNDREVTITWNTGLDEMQGNASDGLYLFFMYDDHTFRFTFLDHLPVCRGDGYASIVLKSQERNPVHLYYFFGSVNQLHFSDSGYCCLRSMTLIRF